MGVKYDNPEKAQQYAPMNYSSILYADFNWKTHLLELKGIAQKKENERAKKYITRLMKFGYTEDEISNFLIEKHRLNNPDHLISPEEQL